MKRILISICCIALIVVLASCSKYNNLEIKKGELPQKIEYAEKYEGKVVCEINDVSYETGFSDVEVIATVKMDKNEIKSSTYNFPLIKCFLKNSKNVIVTSQIQKLEIINEGDSIEVTFKFSDLIDSEIYTPTFKLISRIEALSSN